MQQGGRGPHNLLGPLCTVTVAVVTVVLTQCLWGCDHKQAENRVPRDGNQGRVGVRGRRVLGAGCGPGRAPTMGQEFRLGPLRKHFPSGLQGCSQESARLHEFMHLGFSF